MHNAEITRPAVYAGFTAFAALLIGTFLGSTAMVYLAAVCLLTGIVLLFLRCYRKSPALLLTLFTAALFFLYYAVCCSRTVTPYAQYAGEKHTVEAEILSKAEESSGNFYYKARVLRFVDYKTETNFTVRLSHGESLNAEIGDTVSCTVKFFDYQDKFGLSSKTSRLAEGVVLGAYIADYENIAVQPAEKRNLPYYFAQIREHMDARIKRVLPQKEATVLSAMLLGLRDEIPDDLNGDYKGAGATHILVISGMHMAIVSQFMLRLLQQLGLRRRIAAGFTVPLILGFMAVSGFSSSVVRSGITQIIFLLGLMTGRKPDALNSLGISAFLILLFRPFWIGSISFLLSFTATVGIITLQPRLLHALTCRLHNSKKRQTAIKLLSPAVCSVAAILGSLPVQLYVFGTLNLTSVFTSVLILGASAWIIRLGLPAVLLLCLPAVSAASAPLILITGLLIRYQNFVVAFVSGHLPDTAHISGGYVQGTVLVIAAFLLLVFWLRGRKPLPLSAFALSALLLLTGTAADALLSLHQTKLLVCQTAYTSCTAVVRGDTAAVLSCNGSAATVTDLLQKHGANKLDLILVSEKESEIRCAEDLAENFQTDLLLVPDSVYFPTDIPVENYRYGTTTEGTDGLIIEISSAGDLLSFSVYGRQIVCDENGAAYTDTACDVAIVDSPASCVHGTLTLLTGEEDLYTLAPDLTTGQYILLSEHETVCLCFKRDGSYTVQNG